MDTSSKTSKIPRKVGQEPPRAATAPPRSKKRKGKKDNSVPGEAAAPAVGEPASPSPAIGEPSSPLPAIQAEATFVTSTPDPNKKGSKARSRIPRVRTPGSGQEESTTTTTKKVTAKRTSSHGSGIPRKKPEVNQSVSVTSFTTSETTETSFETSSTHHVEHDHSDNNGQSKPVELSAIVDDPDIIGSIVSEPVDEIPIDSDNAKLGDVVYQGNVNVIDGELSQVEMATDDSEQEAETEWLKVDRDPEGSLVLVKCEAVENDAKGELEPQNQVISDEQENEWCASDQMEKESLFHRQTQATHIESKQEIHYNEQQNIQIQAHQETFHFQETQEIHFQENQKTSFQERREIHYQTTQQTVFQEKHEIHYDNNQKVNFEFQTQSNQGLEAESQKEVEWENEEFLEVNESGLNFNKDIEEPCITTANNFEGGIHLNEIHEHEIESNQYNENDAGSNENENNLETANNHTLVIDDENINYHEQDESENEIEKYIDTNNHNLVIDDFKNHDNEAYGKSEMEVSPENLPHLEGYTELSKPEVEWSLDEQVANKSIEENNDNFNTEINEPEREVSLETPIPQLETLSELIVQDVEDIVDVHRDALDICELSSDNKPELVNLESAASHDFKYEDLETRHQMTEDDEASLEIPDNIIQPPSIEIVAAADDILLNENIANISGHEINQVDEELNESIITVTDSGIALEPDSWKGITEDSGMDGTPSITQNIETEHEYESLEVDAENAPASFEDDQKPTFESQLIEQASSSLKADVEQDHSSYAVDEDFAIESTNLNEQTNAESPASYAATPTAHQTGLPDVNGEIEQDVYQQHIIEPSALDVDASVDIAKSTANVDIINAPQLLEGELEETSTGNTELELDEDGDEVIRDVYKEHVIQRLLSEVHVERLVIPPEDSSCDSVFQSSDVEVCESFSPEPETHAPEVIKSPFSPEVNIERVPFLTIGKPKVVPYSIQTEAVSKTDSNQRPTTPVAASIDSSPGVVRVLSAKTSHILATSNMLRACLGRSYEERCQQQLSPGSASPVLRRHAKVIDVDHEGTNWQMTPPEDVTNLAVLEQMLESASNYEQRRRIRARIRNLNKNTDGECKVQNGHRTPAAINAR